MCEIAVAVVDTINSDFYLNCQCYKAGDVIEVVADGWNWGNIDKAHPNWRIFKFPGVAVSAFTQFLTPQIAADLNNPSKTLLRRALSFNYASLHIAPSVAANVVTMGKVNPYIADAKRAASSLSLSLAVADIASLTVTKALVQDPAIIGVVHANVIG